jgi:hypothetical protein
MSRRSIKKKSPNTMKKWLADNYNYYMLGHEKIDSEKFLEGLSHKEKIEKLNKLVNEIRTLDVIDETLKEMVDIYTKLGRMNGRLVDHLVTAASVHSFAKGAKGVLNKFMFGSIDDDIRKLLRKKEKLELSISKNERILLTAIIQKSYLEQMLPYMWVLQSAAYYYLDK